jgi:hypothetical protein
VADRVVAVTGTFCKQSVRIKAHHATMQITPDQCRLIMLLAELCIKHNLLPTDEYLEARELMEFVQINRDV